MSAVDQRSKEIKHQSSAFMLLILDTSVFVAPSIATTQALSEIVANCYQSRCIEYEDFLERNFNSTSNSTHSFFQVYNTSNANNETYNIKEMLQQPDKMDFLKAMESEVASLFNKKIWALIPKSKKVQHYAKQRRQGKEISREQIMMIWSFKRIP